MRRDSIDIKRQATTGSQNEKNMEEKVA